MYYEYLGPGINDPAKLRYKLVLKQYMVCDATSVQIQNPLNFSIFDAGNNSFVENVSAVVTTEENIQNHPNNPCIQNEPTICYKIVTYEVIKELAPSANGYIISKQQCCRITGISNIFDSQTVGATYLMQIPGTSLGVNAEKNSSAKFAQKDTIIVCGNSNFEFPFDAIDADGDVLSYSFCNAFTGGSAQNSQPVTSSNPPYISVPYAFPFNGSQPLGDQVTINPVTGLISGIAPSAGVYVVTVCCSEFRNGIKINEVRKELHISSGDCVPLKAQLNPIPTTCDGFTVHFANAFFIDPNATYEWEFGDPGSGADNFSALPTPSHTFSAAGDYEIKLKVSLNGLCASSTTAIVKVYPGFNTGFTHPDFLCKGVPIQFNDVTTTQYGVVNKWSWNFGDPNTVQDVSDLPDPTYTYNNTGQYNVSFIVSNSKGCIDTINKIVTVLDKPPLTVFPKDTTFCALDKLQLTATGNGDFSWEPNVNITGANTATPLVNPGVPTKYFVTLTNSGCVAKDSVTVTPKNDLINSIIASNTSICEEDTITLTGNSNYINNLTWQWTPAISVENANAKVTKAYPAVATNYILTTTWGANCKAVDNEAIMVKPLATANAGPDTYICKDQGNVQLNASGGETYLWTPATGLSNPNIANPVATPLENTIYTVAVGVAGCTTTRSDQVIVDVKAAPFLDLTKDTLICSIDDLVLTATGNGNILWTPNYNINDVNSFTPTVSPDVPTIYNARLTDAFGCITDKSVNVDVKAFVTLDAGNDTTICQTDAITINTIGDALHYKWTPATGLNSDIEKNPVATPLNTTLYHVEGNIGSCKADDEILITVVPYPVANAGQDASICFGTETQLSATGGSVYLWSPDKYLSDANSSNPVAKPPSDMQYIVTVTDILGCPKPVRDTVLVNVIKVMADAGPSDTTVVESQQLQLNGTGGVTYLWTPNTWLNNPLIATPVALPQGDIEYKLLVKSIEGCEGRDSIRVKFFKVKPDLYVPNAFTPNGDGLNDVIRPVLLGMKELKYFRVYNRWGQLVFSTSTQQKGWDGNLAGKPQESGTYVWLAEGITFNGIVRQQKGYVVLIR